MATIVSFPARSSARTGEMSESPRPRLTSVLLAVAAPILAAGLCWGMVDALAFTQGSLMGLYSATASAA